MECSVLVMTWPQMKSRPGSNPDVSVSYAISGDSRTIRRARSGSIIVLAPNDNNSFVLDRHIGVRHYSFARGPRPCPHPQLFSGVIEQRVAENNRRGRRNAMSLEFSLHAVDRRRYIQRLPP